MAVLLSRLCFFLSFFSLHFQGQLKVVHKPLPWFPRYWHWAQFCYAWAAESPPPTPQFIMFGVEHLCNLLTKRQQMWQHCSWGLKAKVTLVSPERLLRKGADVWRQHIYGEGASDEWTSPLNQISCKWFCFLCHFVRPPHPFKIACQVLNLIHDIRQIFHIYWTWNWRVHNEDYWGRLAAESESGGDEDID